MSLERMVRGFAGCFVLIAVALGAPASPAFVSEQFLWLAVFVGANLLQSAFTGICPLEMLLRRIGAGSASASTGA